MPSITATTTHQITITPTIKRQLLKELRLWAELHQQEKAIKLAKSKHAKAVEVIQTELGESSVDIEGFKSTIVAPMRKTFDKIKYVSLGGKLDIYDAAMKETPGKAYVRISPPGEETEAE